jgi:hypothetical protein
MMILLLFALLAPLTGAVGDTLPRPAAPAAADAYLDAGARTLVEAARNRRATAEANIVRYRNLSTSRISVGITTLRRERLIYRCESAVRVDWSRSGVIRQEILAAREVIPIVSSRVTPEDSDCSGALFDPGDDRLSFGTGGLLGGDSSFVRHPLAVGSEVDYRFRSGEVTTLRLADGRVIRLREVQVIPRRTESRLVSGSIWLEEESMAVVRAVLRLARPFDLGRDAGDSDSDVPAILRPVRGDLRYITMEYGLWEGRWWLPRLVAVEGEVQAGVMGRLPLRVEQGYTDYRVWGEADDHGIDPLVLAGPGVECTPRRRRARTEPVSGDSASAQPEAEPTGSVNIGTGGASVRIARPTCICRDGRCWQVERVLPADTAELLHSEHLPPSIFQEGDVIFTEREREELRDRLRAAAPPPWQVARPELRWGLQGLDLVRYNRVEGLSVGARGELALGRATVDGTVRLGFADLVPGAEIGVTSRGVTTERRLAGYHRLETVRFGERALGPGNSLGALLFGRDDGLYFRSAGAELLLSPVAGPAGFSARLFAEHQRGAERNTHLAVPRFWRDSVFGENIVADDAALAGGRLAWSFRRGLDPTGVRTSLMVAAEAAGGDFAFVQPWLVGGVSFPVGARLLAGLEVGAGTSLGEVPTQRLWYLGGPGTVRGYGPAASYGEAFWRARAEVGRASPGARLILFGDAGSAGPAGDLEIDPALLSVGAGASFFDGLIRLDLARGLRGNGGWRLDMHLDSPL